MPFTLWGRTRIRQALATATAAAVGLVPVIMVGSPAHAAPTGKIADLTISAPSNWAGGKLSYVATYTGNTSGTFTFVASAGTANAAQTGGNYTAVGAAPTTLLSYAAPTLGADPVTISFRQAIGATDQLRAGNYTKTLTFTLSTTTP